MDYGLLIPFIAYFAAIVLIGVYATRFSSKGMTEFFLGGRQMSMFVVALSAVVSGRSAWLLLGFTGQSYSMGLSAIWAVIGYTVVEFFLFIYYAPRIRTFTEKYKALTIPDFFVARFDDSQEKIRKLLITIFLIFMVSYIAAQFVGGGKAFYAYFGLPQSSGLILTAVIVLAYTLMGGFLAVSLTDVLQAFVMLLALLILPTVGIIRYGGFSEIFNSVETTQEGFFNPLAFGFGSMIGFLGIGLGSPGNPHILVRYMSIKDPAMLKTSAWVGTAWNIVLALGAFMIGIVARAYYPEASALPNSDPENAFLHLADRLLPAFMNGIILAAVFAAIMSTADSQLLVAGSSLVRDLYEKILHKDKFIPQKKLTFLSRVAVSILVYLAIVLGLLVEDLVFWLVLFAWAGLGAALGPTSILALFWKKTTKKGVMAGMITGTFTVIIWKSIPALSGWLYELIPGFFLALIVTFLVSLAGSRKKKPD